MLIAFLREEEGMGRDRGVREETCKLLWTRVLRCVCVCVPVRRAGVGLVEGGEQRGFDARREDLW